VCAGAVVAEQAIERALDSSIASSWASPSTGKRRLATLLIGIYAQLGRLDEALAVWRETEARIPGYAARIHDELTKWFAPDLVEHIEEAVGKIRRRATGAP
jgi:pentatricopeptide repeat protein